MKRNKKKKREEQHKRMEEKFQKMKKKMNKKEKKYQKMKTFTSAEMPRVGYVSITCDKFQSKQKFIALGSSQCRRMTILNFKLQKRQR